MSLVVDASIACKWFIDEEGAARARNILLGNRNLLAPDLVIAEVCNAIWKNVSAGRISSDHATAAMDELPRLFDSLIPCNQLGARALAIAASLDHPVYDCFYLALAELNDARVVTADARLLGRLAGTSWAQRVVGVDDLNGGG